MGDYNQLSKQISDLTASEPQMLQQQQQALQNQYGYNDAYNNLQNIRRNVSDTQSSLDALPQQLQQRTAGSLTTAGQLARLQTTESDPISKQLAILNQQQTLGQQDMTDINNNIQQGMTQNRQSFTDQMTALQQQQQDAFNAEQQAQSLANALKVARLSATPAYTPPVTPAVTPTTTATPATALMNGTVANPSVQTSQPTFGTLGTEQMAAPLTYANPIIGSQSISNQLSNVPSLQSILDALNKGKGMSGVTNSVPKGVM